MDWSPLVARREEFGAFVRRRVSVEADVDDVLQQAYLIATRVGSGLRDEAALVPWFYQVLRTTVADHGRARARARRAVVILDPTTTRPPHEVGSCACSLALLAELPAGYVEILSRVDVLEEPIAEVAADLGLTSNNAAVRLHRARKALRDRLASCCGCKSAEECQRCRCATCV